MRRQQEVHLRIGDGAQGTAKARNQTLAEFAMRLAYSRGFVGFQLWADGKHIMPGSPLLRRRADSFREITLLRSSR